MAIDKALQNALGMIGGTMRVHFTMEADTTSVPSSSEEYRMPECGMDVLAAITTRSSVRKYLPHSVSEEDITTILNAAFCAPSAKNKRPWHFVIIRDRKTLEEIASVQNDVSMVKDAGLCIAVCADKNVQGIIEFLYADCASATQNMLLCAHALGLGAVWCGIKSGSEMYKMLTAKLGLPVKVLPFALVAAGVPDEKKELVPRYERQKIHSEKW